MKTKFSTRFYSLMALLVVLVVGSIGIFSLLGRSPAQPGSSPARLSASQSVLIPNTGQSTSPTADGPIERWSDGPFERWSNGSQSPAVINTVNLGDRDAHYTPLPPSPSRTSGGGR